MTYTTVAYEKKGRIAYITLNRPDRMNALNLTMISELVEIWKNVEDDDDVWVAIVTGAGRALCAGADVKAAADSVTSGADALGVRSSEAHPVRVGEKRWGPRTNDVTKPVICAANGPVAGGGLDFVTESDIAICSEDAFFMDPHVSIGWVSSHEMLTMARRIPFGVALRMAIMGRQERMSAERAYEIGLVTEVVPRDRLLERATELAEAVLDNGPLAVRGTKHIMWKTLGMPIDEAEAIGDGVLLRVAQTEDHAEGPLAFTEKRKPRWKGR